MFIIASLFSIGSGVIFPIFSIFLSKMLIGLLALTKDSTNTTEIDKMNLYSLILFLISVYSFVVKTIHYSLFNIIGEHVTRKIRVETFSKILMMPIAWFDLPRNNAGILSTRLLTDCFIVN